MLSLHPLLAEMLNPFLSLLSLAGAVLVFGWALDLTLMRLRYGPYKELRAIYHHAARFFYPLGAVVATLGSFMTLFYSEYLGYMPCFLCWVQRICLYPLVPLFIIAWWKGDRHIYRYTAALSFVGLVVAIYHEYIQLGYNPFLPCGSAGPFVDCAKPSFVYFHFVTFPFWAIVLFAFLFLLSLTVRMKIHRDRRVAS